MALMQKNAFIEFFPFLSLHDGYRVSSLLRHLSSPYQYINRFIHTWSNYLKKHDRKTV